MDLLEFQGKQFFATYDIPISAGRAVDTVESAVSAAEAVGGDRRSSGSRHEPPRATARTRNLSAVSTG